MDAQLSLYMLKSGEQNALLSLRRRDLLVYLQCFHKRIFIAPRNVRRLRKKRGVMPQVGLARVMPCLRGFLPGCDDVP